ncbi:MAG: DegT/DnrJ/EryC1/StrS family aminotransferase [Myxococcota bacterium]|nr:DegT/DnrJ/EryC1/StrS family aminotransferase [Myxococcota bacterium]
MGVPFVDLATQLRSIRAEIDAAIARVLDDTSFVLGPHLEAFERDFARFCEVTHAIGVANGTDALELAFRALALRGEVVMPANTFIATPLAAVRAGLRPVFVDVDPDTLLLDPRGLEDAIGGETSAIAPVHLFGQVAPMAPLAALAERRDLAIVEDAAQAHGARRGGKRAGTFGDVAATSFYPGKNLGAYGDGGAVMTDDDELAAELRALRNYGSEVKYHHPKRGFNSRLDPMQAAILGVKLTHLERWTEARRAAAARYHERLAGIDGVRLPVTPDDTEPVWHLYVVRVEERDRVKAAMEAAGVGIGVHYPVPCHLQGAFAHLGHAPGDFPVAEEAARTMLSLPMFPEITEAQQDEVVAALTAAL